MHVRAVESMIPLVGRPNRQQILIAALLFVMWSGFTAAQPAASPSGWLPLVNISMDDSGDLVSWHASRFDGGQFSLLDAGKKFLTFQLFIGDKEAGSQVVWRRLQTPPELLGLFIGQHTELGLVIRRSYLPGVEPGTIIHELSLLRSQEFTPDDFLVQIAVQPTLQKHSPEDGSFGSFFYGYNRVLAATQSNVDEFESVEESLQTSAVALVARHLAIVTSLDDAGDDIFIADMEAGARLTISNSNDSTVHRQTLGALELRNSTITGTKFSGLMYSEMSSPLRIIARLIERTLESFVALVGGAGAAIILFALLLRVLLLPLGIWAIRQQRHFAAIQRQMKPRLKEINDTLKGAEKSEAMLATYKEFGISPFSGLKGSLGLFVQLPILIALFAVTTESAMFRDAPFLWLSDLSLPDRTIALPFAVPGLGSYLNVLPILLGIVTITAALIQSRSREPGSGSSPRSGLILALIFVIFFYPCAAALVIYWTLVNTLQIFEGLYVSRRSSS